MSRIKKFYEYSEINEEFFGSLATNTGKVIGVEGWKQGIGKQSAYQTEEPGFEDEGIGEQILERIQGMPKIYNKTGEYVPEIVKERSHNWYCFIDKFGKDRFLVNIIKHGKFKRHHPDEITVSLSKEGERSRKKSGSSVKFKAITLTSGKAGKNFDIFSPDSNLKEERINISPELAEKIFLEAQKVSNIVTKTTKGQFPNPPKVKITKPVKNPSKSWFRSNTIEAEVKNIKDASQIDFIVNGVSIKDFEWDNKTGEFTATVKLKKGDNNIQITATNHHGSDSDSRDIRCRF